MSTGIAQRSVLWMGAVGLGAGLGFSSTASAVLIIPTSFGVGADAEVRDHQPTTNFGAGSELASRIADNFPAGHANDGGDRMSMIYLKFDLSNATFVDGDTASVRLTFRNTSMSVNRVEDTETPNPGFRTGLAFYGLDRDDAGNAWDESTITYATAPGLQATDNNNGTKDYDLVDPDGGGSLRAPMRPLGIALFPEMGTQNHYAVGSELVFSSQALSEFILAAVNASKETVTVVAGVAHDGKVPVSAWKNFNYLFNPKELLTLNTDPGYDADTTDPNNPLGSPWSGASNATDPLTGFSPFSPQLILTPIPEPGSLALLGAAGLLLVRRRR